MGRITRCTVNAGSTGVATTYGYLAGGHGTGSTTPLVQTITQSGTTLTYTYDNVGNITSVGDGSKTVSYEYDTLGQLIRVNDPYDTTAGTSGTTWKYAYDQGGNIQSKIAYTYTTGTVGSAVKTDSFAYGDSNWKDKLTAYNGQTITCDAIGNPLTDGTWTYTWQAGRQLKQMTKSGKTVEFMYNHEGLRIKKTVDSVKTIYTLHGKNIVHLTHGNSDWMHFFYDAQNKPAVVIFNGTAYAYLYNLQGDVVGLLDSNGAKMVSYTYDAWGKPISKTGTLASTLGTIQPFRYRGYVYDEETGLYYLCSRFYHPSLGRFCNADKRIVKNLFAYCNNRPTSKIDSTGCSEEPFPDFTDVLNKELEKQVLSEFGTRRIGDGTDNSLSFAASNVLPFLWFAETMLDNGPISYKTDSVWNNAFPSLPTADKVSKFIFRGRETTREDYGNIAFGYLGSAMGISREYLLFGAGVYKKAKKIAEQTDRTWNEALTEDPLTFMNDVLEAVIGDSAGYWGNDKNDYRAILFGIDQYYFDNGSN